MMRKDELDSMRNNIPSSYINATGKTIIDNKILNLIHVFFDSELSALVNSITGPVAPDGFSGKCHF